MYVYVCVNWQVLLCTQLPVWVFRLQFHFIALPHNSNKFIHIFEVSYLLLIAGQGNRCGFHFAFGLFKFTFG